MPSILDSGKISKNMFIRYIIEDEDKHNLSLEPMLNAIKDEKKHHPDRECPDCRTVMKRLKKRNCLMCPECYIVFL